MHTLMVLRSGLNKLYTLDKKENKKLQKTQFTIQEIWQAMRGNVHKSKKQYTRTKKHKKKDGNV